MDIFTLMGKIMIDSSSAQDALHKIEEKVGGVGDKLTTAGEKISKFGDGMTKVGTNLTTKVTLPLVGIGTAIVKASSDFEAGMSKVQAISGASGEDLDKLKEKAKEMGATTKFSATESAEAMEYMAMAGWKTSDMVDGISGIMNLAAASGEELATTSDIVTDALTAFGLTAKDSGHFADILAAASSNANTNVSMMGETFKYCAPIAGALGYSAEDTAVAIGLMGNAGIKSSQAGTSLRKIMSELQGTFEISGKSLGNYVVETTNADGTMRSFSDIIGDCREAFGQLSESEKASAAETLVGKEAMSGFLAIMNAAPQDVEKFTNAIEGCDGVAESMANTMNDNLQGQIILLKSALKGVAIQLGETLIPILKNVVEHISGMVDWFANLDPSIQETTVYVGLLAAALGPILVVGGKLISGIGSIVSIVGTCASAISGLASGTGALATAFTVLTGPIGIAIAAITAIGAALVYLYNTNEDFRNKINALWEQIKQLFSSACEAIKNIISAFIDACKALWSRYGKEISEIISSAWNGIQKVFSAAIDVISGILKVFIDAFKGDWSKLWADVKNLLSAGWELIKSLFSASIDAVLTVLVNAVVMFIKAGKDLIDGLGNGIKNAWETVKPWFNNFLDHPIQTIKGTASRFMSVGRDIINSLWDGLKSAWESVTAWFTEKWNWICDKVSSITGKAGEVNTATSSVNGSHKAGLYRVPFDGYRAELHEGERVLTKQEAKEYNSKSNTEQIINANVDMSTLEAKLDKLIAVVGNIPRQQRIYAEMG